MKIIPLLAILFAFFAAAVWADSYMLVRVPVRGPGAMARLGAVGLGLEEGTRWTTDGVELVVSKSEAARLREAGFTPVVLHPDLESFYRSRLSAGAMGPSAPGKMGGYYTFSETLQKLQSLRKKYPSLLSLPEKIGTSVEGRPILAYKISANAAEDEAEPEALFTALHHAREPQSLMCILYFTERLLLGYGKDPGITYLLNHRQLWIVPVVNPDGYVYNEQTNPSGGGLWRKNRRNNGDGSFGVDLNRNYGWMWGVDDLGSSSAGGDETYRGTTPFSEPETDAIRKFVARRNIATALNFHSFRNVLLYPWSYQGARTPHHAIFRDMAIFLTRISGYQTGNTAEMLRYTANGEAGDWMYGDTSGKSRIFALSPEVGGFMDGFWPPASRILPLSRENYDANLSLAWMAGAYPTLSNYVWKQVEGDNDNYLEPGERHGLALTLRNRGMQQAKNIVVNVRSGSRYVVPENSTINFGNINSFRNLTRKNLVVQFLPDAPRNKALRLDLLISSEGETMRKETVWLRLGDNN